MQVALAAAGKIDNALCNKFGNGICVATKFSRLPENCDRAVVGICKGKQRFRIKNVGPENRLGLHLSTPAPTPQTFPFSY